MKVIKLHQNLIIYVERAVKKDREAQRILYEMFAPQMLSACRYYIRDVQHAEEVMLNGFLKAFTNLHQFQNLGSFEGWLRKIMLREALSFLNRAQPIAFSDTDVAAVHAIAPLDEAMDVAEIQSLIDGLPDGYRMVFVMYAIEGYKHREIADVLNITEGTSKSQLFKARQMLQAQLKTLNTSSYVIR